MSSFDSFLPGTGFFVFRIFGFSFTAGSIEVDNKIILKQNASSTNTSDTAQLESISKNAVANSSSNVSSVQDPKINDPVTISFTLELPREQWNSNYTDQTTDNYKVLTSKIQGYVDEAMKKKFGDDFVGTKEFTYS